MRDVSARVVRPRACRGAQVYTVPHFLLHYDDDDNRSSSASSSSPSPSRPSGGDGGWGYADAVRETIRIGGESGARGMWIGALLAAQRGGLDAIPADWAARTAHYDEASERAAR